MTKVQKVEATLAPGETGIAVEDGRGDHVLLNLFPEGRPTMVLTALTGELLALAVEVLNNEFGKKVSFHEDEDYLEVHVHNAEMGSLAGSGQYVRVHRDR